MMYFIAKQSDIPFNSYESYIFNSKTTYRHKREILKFYEFREETASDINSILTWLYDRVYMYNQDPNLLTEEVYKKYYIDKIPPPSD